jgi:hypothetical protein
MRHLVDEAARRSTAIREWLDRLESLDVTVNPVTLADFCSRIGIEASDSGMAWNVN